MTDYSTADQHCALNFHKFPDKDVNPKLLSPRGGSHSPWARCHPKVFAVRVAALLVFHLLDTLLALSGAGLVVAFAALRIALLPMVLTIFVFAVFVEAAIERLRNRDCVLLFLLVFVLTTVALILSFGFRIFCYVCGTAPIAAIIVILVQRLLVLLNVVTVRGLASLDVELANFVVRQMSLHMYSAISKDETKLPAIPTNLSTNIAAPDRNFIRGVFASPAMWSAVFYFLVPKLLVGILSAVSVWLSVAQPIVVLASSGRFPFVGSGATFQDDPSVYVAIVVVLGAAGVVGLILVPVWSVRLSAWGWTRTSTRPTPSNLEATRVSSIAESEDHGAFVLL